MDPTYNPSRLGRKLPPEETRRNTISVRFTDDELGYLSARADDMSLSVPAYCRLCVFAKSMPAIVRIPEINQEAWSLLGRLGVNLNRCVKFIHCGDLAQADTLLPILEDILTALPTLRAGLVKEETK